jgi:RNA polymerase sigma factor (sigma-70 family)
MYEKNRDDQVRRLAEELYEAKYGYLLRIAKRNAASGSDAEEALQDAFASFLSEFDPARGAPPLAWITVVLKRRCWRLRDKARLDRRVVADAGAEHQEPVETIESVPERARPLADRVADRCEARQHLRQLKPDERTAIGMVATGYTYEEVVRLRGWSHTKVNRCLYEGRRRLNRKASK